MPEKSAIEFLIFACVTISWPFRMPPSSSPMMTSTMAISTRVKPWRRFIASSLAQLPVQSLAQKKGRRGAGLLFLSASLQRAADRVDVGAGLRVRRAGRRRGDVRIGRGLQLRAHGAGGDG